MQGFEQGHIFELSPLCRLLIGLKIILCFVVFPNRKGHRHFPVLSCKVGVDLVNMQLQY